MSYCCNAAIGYTIYYYAEKIFFEMTEKETRNTVFYWLDNVRKRPDMYFQSLRELEAMIFVYYITLGSHRVIEDAPSMTEHFRTWLWVKKKWSMSCSWADALERSIKGSENQVDR